MANPSAEKPYGKNSALAFTRCTRNGDQYRWTEHAARTGDMGLQLVYKKDQGKTYAFIGWSGLYLDPDRLYRFSVHYRTRQEEPQPRLLRIWGGDAVFRYPSSAGWTRAQVLFRGRTNTLLRVDAHGVKDGVAIRASEGPKDAQGRFPLLNRIDLTIDLDDFDLRELAAPDFEGNVVANAGFETGDAFPPAWEASPVKVAVLDDAAPHSGQKALRLDAEPGTGAGLRSAPIPLKSGTIYVISVWMKSQRLENDKLTLALAKGTGIKSTDRWWHRTVTPAMEWQSREFYIETAAKGEFMYQGEAFVARLTLTFSPRDTAASLWIDDVEVRTME